MTQQFKFNKKFLKNELINQAIDKMKLDFSDSIYNGIGSGEVLEDILLEEYAPYVLRQIKALIEISKPDYNANKEISIKNIYDIAKSIGLSKYADISYRVFHYILTDYKGARDIRISKKTCLIVWAFLIIKIDYKSIPQLIEQQRQHVISKALQRYSNR